MTPRRAARRPPRCRARTRALVACALLVFGCGDGARDAGVDTRPGAELFTQRARLEVQTPGRAFALPDAARDALERLRETPSWSLPSEAWTAVELLGAEESAALLTRVRAGGTRRATRWELAAPFNLRLPVGEPRLEFAGAPLRSRRRALPDGSPTRVWRDSSVPMVIWLEDRGARLVAVAEQRPPELTLRRGPGGGASAGWWRDADSSAPPDVHRVSLGNETRPVLAVATPSRLGFDTARLDAAQLEVGVARARLAVTWDGQALRPADAPAQLRFAVDVLHDGERTRAWSHELGASARFVDARVDLSAWKGRACRIELVTESDTPDTEAFAMWSTLRFRDARHAPPARPHLVLLDLDTLRADGLGCYGNPRDTSPRLDAWAAREAVRFSDHVSVNNWTLPSTVSMLTGLPVSAHGVLRFPLAMDARHAPLAQRLAAAGYETLGRSDGGFVTPEHGFATGFDRFVVDRPPTAEFEREGWSRELAWLRERDSARPVFLFVQTYAAHAPFLNDPTFDDPAAPYAGPLAAEPVQKHHVDAALAAAGGTLDAAERRYLRDVYDAGVRRLDTVVGRFLDALPEIFGDEPYAVVITSDHGEALGERDSIGHGTSLHGEQLRVPLLVRPPTPRARAVVDAPVSGLDLAPTLLGFAGLRGTHELPGRDLFHDTLRADHLRVSRHDEHAAAVQRLHGKLVTDTRAERRGLGAGLYDLASDPHERAPLDPGATSRAAELRAALEAYAAEHTLRAAPGSHAGAVEAEHLEALAELGYLQDG